MGKNKARKLQTEQKQMWQTNSASQRQLRTSGIACPKYSATCLKPNSTGKVPIQRSERALTVMAGVGESCGVSPYFAILSPSATVEYGFHLGPVLTFCNQQPCPHSLCSGMAIFTGSLKGPMPPLVMAAILTVQVALRICTGI